MKHFMNNNFVSEKLRNVLDFASFNSKSEIMNLFSQIHNTG